MEITLHPPIIHSNGRWSRLLSSGQWSRLARNFHAPVAGPSFVTVDPDELCRTSARR
jgi:hypothetical protein